MYSAINKCNNICCLGLLSPDLLNAQAAFYKYRGVHSLRMRVLHVCMLSVNRVAEQIYPCVIHMGNNYWYNNYCSSYH